MIGKKGKERGEWDQKQGGRVPGGAETRKKNTERKGYWAPQAEMRVEINHDAKDRDMAHTSRGTEWPASLTDGKGLRAAEAVCGLLRT